MREQQHAKKIYNKLKSISYVDVIILYDIKPDPNEMYTVTKPCDAIFIFKGGLAAYIECKMIDSLSANPLKLLTESQKQGVATAKKMYTPYIIISILKSNTKTLLITDAINDISIACDISNLKSLIEFIIQTRSHLLNAPKS